MPQHDLVCLHGGAGADEWFARQVEALGARVWEPRISLAMDVAGVSGQLEMWVDAASLALRESASGPAHIVATGAAAYGAIVLAATHPDQVKSIILGDPEVDTTVDGYANMLRRVRAPSLVIAAAPRSDTDISKPQSIAGGIANGVFVILDNADAPAHRTRPDSFNEWATSFMNIAEGLHAVGSPQEEANA
ncbi:alpha/beta fold hydrolase [Paenarthrobacter sp. NPDC092416]|uniref:alpha/beta fold hydrolase n=1 Tax=Paenarthrobacter sp. NPDC092416 TaxID=3364386 RepID=UPI0038155648